MKTFPPFPQYQRGFGIGKFFAWLFAIPVFLAISGGLVTVIVIALANDRVPPIDAMLEYRPRMPLQIYTVDNKLIGEFGTERRKYVAYENIPTLVKQAVLAAEDARFFEHNGVDIVGIGRAALANLRAGGTVQGASTITQQLAREFFLSNERTYSRKLAEALTALRIEREMSKEQIFELYLNQIFLGKRAYGFEAAARTYFGKSLTDLSIAEAAMLAGLPKAPSRYNPLVNPKRAKQRQLYILNRMREHQFIDSAELQAAVDQTLTYAQPKDKFADLAPFVAELARKLVFQSYKESAYTAGLKVYTTVHSRDQQLARRAVRNGILDYEKRNPYRGPEKQFDLPKEDKAAVAQIDKLIAEVDPIEGLLPAVVLSASRKGVKVSRGKQGMMTIKGDAMDLAIGTFRRPRRGQPIPVERPKRGSLVRVVKRGDIWELAQLPKVQAAFVATNTHDGSIRALVGGFNFEENRFNHVTQAWRQPGSSFKPFIFSAALTKGFTTSTVINDAPISLIDEDPEEGPQLWEPKNFGGRFDGPVTLRTALKRSKNMVSVRVMQRIGAKYARRYVTKFGFERRKHPPVLTLGLGTGLVTPLQMVSAISVFANGGYKTNPYLISHITDTAGNLVAVANPKISGNEENRVIDPRNAYIMDSMLRGVARSGTAAKARKYIQREDLAGKTGTTNESHDAWFVGYQPSIAATAWVGYDQPRELGVVETGGKVALPIWIEYMKSALKDVPLARQTPPPGVIQIQGDLYLSDVTPENGIQTLGMSEGGITTGTKGRRAAEKLRNEVF